ncbi:unnamed protein product [Urochloa decumbens]|uniref:BHLH domain-containing protein n=1 Tax=Urochloa decumbens TaxID=240449 RepID=A0ABC9H2M3_9POAL
MALEAVVFPNEHLACTPKAAVAAHSALLTGCGGGFDVDELEEKGGVVLQGEAADALLQPLAWDAALCPCSVAEECCWDAQRHLSVSPPPVSVAPAGRGKAAASRRRRRRPKAVKNTEEMESQRRNHIAVERNRRRQMNEYLSVLRSVMPPSYAQRGDQASIVAGAINFVKELEQMLQSLEAHKRRAAGSCAEPPPFAGFFTFPQYSTGATGAVGSSCESSGGSAGGDQSGGGGGGCAGARRGVADIEVAVAESHANVKVLAPRRPRQLLRMVVALQCLGLTVLHLNVTTTADHLAFYSFSLKMEDECRLSSVDDIAAAVNEIVAKASDERLSQLAA